MCVYTTYKHIHIHTDTYIHIHTCTHTIHRTARLLGACLGAGGVGEGRAFGCVFTGQSVHVEERCVGAEGSSCV